VIQQLTLKGALHPEEFGRFVEPPGGAKRRFSIDSPFGSASEACNLEPPAVVLRLSTENGMEIMNVKSYKNIIIYEQNEPVTIRTSPSYSRV